MYGIWMFSMQKEGFTALFLTASQNNPSMCLMLLEAGADPMIAGGRQNITPLHIAAHLLVLVANNYRKSVG